MTTHVIKSDMDMAALRAALVSMKRPFTVDIRQGKHRSVEQNRLQRKWARALTVLA